MTRKLFSKNLARGIIIGLLIMEILAAQIIAGTSTKTFDFGPGGDNPSFRSHSRAFAPPDKVAILVAINYRTASDLAVPIVVEVEDASGGTLATREISAGKTPQRLVINIAATDNRSHGCEKFWNVRVQTKAGEIPAARVWGDITFSFVDPVAAPVEVEGPAGTLAKGRQVTRNVGSTGSFNHPGVMTVQASWLHSQVNLVLPLKFELVRPDASIAKTLIGYAMNSTGNPRLNFNHSVTAAESKQVGVWKLRISNETEHEIIEIRPTVTFTKKCLH